jgi:hypothetical protein
VISVNALLIPTMEIAIKIMAITVLTAEVICAFNLQTMVDRMKCNDNTKIETEELGISPM